MTVTFGGICTAISVAYLAVGAVAFRRGGTLAGAALVFIGAMVAIVGILAS